MPGQILLWSLVLVAVIVSGTLTLKWLRAYLLGGQGDDDDGGWTLHGLRQLRAQGQLTDAEYQRARQLILDQHVGNHGDAAHGEVLAPPGYDLTGDPLPTREEGKEPDRPSD